MSHGKFKTQKTNPPLRRRARISSQQSFVDFPAGGGMMSLVFYDNPFRHTSNGFTQTSGN